MAAHTGQIRMPYGTPNHDTAWIQTRVSVVMPLALRCKALDHCATREPHQVQIYTECTKH